MNIVALPFDQGGVGAYRCVFPVEELRRKGHRAWAPPYTDVPAGDDEAAEGAVIRSYHVRGMLDPGYWNDIDVFFPGRRHEPAVPLIASVARSQGVGVVADVDDLLRGMPDYNPAKPKADRGAPTFDMLLDRSHVLTVSTPELELEHADRDPILIRNAIPARRWRDTTPAYEHEREKTRVGWMGSHRWRPADLGGDLSLLQPWLGDWLRSRDDVEFVCAGDPKLADHIGLPADKVVLHDPVMLHRIHEILDFDIGLVPLVDNRFNRAKSCLKGMEYAAAGILPVASPLPEYRWLASQAGIVLSEAHEWQEILNTLVDDKQQREQRARAARSAVLGPLSQERNAWRWERAFETARDAASDESSPATAVGTLRRAIGV
jgi:hypothetical protein